MPRRIETELVQHDSDAYPFHPSRHITLGRNSKGRGGQIRLSPQLMTEGEIDFSCNLLIADIEKVRKEAKKQLPKARGFLGSKSPAS